VTPPLAAVLSALGAYLLLQVVLNYLNLRAVLRVPRERRPLALVVAAFWSGIANAAYFAVAAIVLRVQGYVAAPFVSPESGGLWAHLGLGLVLGPLLWYWTTLARGAGRRLFGAGEIAGAEEAILRSPPGMHYVVLGVLNLFLFQPLGRELFIRGVLLAVVQRELALRHSPSDGWPLAIALMLLVDVLLRLNVVWLFATLTHGLIMAALYYYTGDALAGLLASMIAGLIQAVVQLRLTIMKFKQREAKKAALSERGL
jgi:hypothetical protein